MLVEEKPYKSKWQKLHVMVPVELMTKIIEADELSNIDSLITYLLEEYYENQRY